MAYEKTILLVLGLIAVASAQNMTDEMNDTMTTAEMPMPTTQPAPQELNGTDLTARYAGQEATDTRNNHFYCLGENSNRANFREVAEYRWGIWIQYPVLSYLDTMRKRHLFYAIAQMSGANFNDICVAEVEQYGVATYRESEFIKLYIRNSDVMSTLTTYDAAFRSNIVESNPYVSLFLRELAINVSTTNPGSGPNLNSRTVNDSVHPGCDMEQCPEGDPTLLAVVVGTYVGKWYTMSSTGEEEEVTIENLKNGIAGYTRVGNFVNNPRPINYGLEPGDIIFAVFGGLLLIVLSVAIVFGFVIHPFYLS